MSIVNVFDRSIAIEKAVGSPIVYRKSYLLLYNNNEVIYIMKACSKDVNLVLLIALTKSTYTNL